MKAEYIGFERDDNDHNKCTLFVYGNVEDAKNFGLGDILNIVSDKNKLKISKYEMTCGGCPSQWNLWTDDNEYIYVRYRHGWLTAEINSGDSFEEKEIYSGCAGDKGGGVMNNEQMMHILKDVLDFSHAECI